MTDEQPTPHTYEQAAQALGINAEAVRARLRRGALRRGPRTNDGRPTVLLSAADVATLRTGARPIVRPESTPEAAPDPDGHAREVAALREVADVLRDQLARAQADADVARAGREADREQAAQERERLAGILAVAQAAQAAAEAGRQTATGEAADLRRQLADLQGRGWLARLLGRTGSR